jgi:hypothetical protein
MELNIFNAALIKWIIVAHMALNYVEVDAFRELLLLLNPVIWALLYKAGNSIKKLILRSYEEKKNRVREDIRNSLSKIHINFDLWTSPGETLAFCAVVAHYLNQSLQVKSLLLGLKEIKGSHLSENLAASYLPVIEDFELKKNRIFYVGQRR